MTTKRWILVAAVLASGIVFLDSTVVNVALPRMGRDLPRSFLGVLEGQSYVYNAGPQLAGALVFVFLTANFYAALASRLPGVDVLSNSFRSQVSPLNPPTDPQLMLIVRDASTSSFHLAMLVGVGLLVAGALVNAIGIRNVQSREQRVADAQQATPAGA